MSLPRKCLLAAVCAASLSAFPPSASSHGGLSMDEDMCKLRLGRFYMHFTGYQVRPGRPNQEFCEDIPGTGRTIIVMDAIDQQLRTMPVRVQIVTDPGRGSAGSVEKQVTVVDLPAKIYPSGSIPVEITFDQPGRFVGLVTAGENGELVSRFPFSVGIARPQYGFYALLASIVLGGGTMLWFSTRRRARAMQAQSLGQ